jgi:1-pyrroline-5-carboxylate dehydrogenase
MDKSGFKLTYATMFNPPEELHVRFDKALADVKSRLGTEYGNMIAGRDQSADKKFFDRFPADTNMALGRFQKSGAQDGQEAIAAAREAFPRWSATPWQERVALMRKVAALVDQRTFEIGAAMTMSVGKNRMEALGEVAETADLISYACDQMEKNNGFISEMGQDPIPGVVSRNTSALRPYGVWLVVSPFNFPTALTGGPVGAALVTGNTVVAKPSSDVPWSVRLLADCFRDAGLPDGVFNLVTGPGAGVGKAMASSPDVDGVTFTGSYKVGMSLYRLRAQSVYVRPIVLELGGKNPAIVSRNADISKAALGIMRSAFGLQGQKCSACSRVYVEEPVYDRLLGELVDLTEKIVIGDPTAREVYLGPVVHRKAFENFKAYADELSVAGKIATGGKVLAGGEYGRGFFCKPTIVTDVSLDHRLWKHEMFVPIVMVARVRDLAEAMREANDVQYGLTAGFYGSREEAEWFFENIHAGVVYANRAMGATTGAWPGFQPFGGWKASGATGKNAGGLHYLPLYLREQSRTLFL